MQNKRIGRRTVVQNPVRADEADVQRHAPAAEMADDLQVLNPTAGDRRRLTIIGQLIQLKLDPRAPRATAGIRADISERNNQTLTGAEKLAAEAIKLIKRAEQAFSYPYKGNRRKLCRFACLCAEDKTNPTVPGPPLLSRPLGSHGAF